MTVKEPSELSNDDIYALIDALRAANSLIDVALPKFNWANSPLDSHAIRLLNETPAKVRAALRRVGY